MKKEIKFNFGKVVINDSVVLIKIIKEKRINLNDAKYLYDLLKENIDGIYYYIINIGKNSTFSEEAMIFYSYGDGRLVDAIIINDYNQRLNVEYYCNKSKIPAKIFRNTKRANEWIKKLKYSTK
jgi:hypothetical protein